MTVVFSSQRRRGFTLIEVLVALIVVTMGTLAVAGQIGQTARNARLIQAKTFATWIAPLVGDNVGSPTPITFQVGLMCI